MYVKFYFKIKNKIGSCKNINIENNIVMYKINLFILKICFSISVEIFNIYLLLFLSTLFLINNSFLIKFLYLLEKIYIIIIYRSI